MEQNILKKSNYHLPLTSNRYPVTSLEFNVNLETRRLRVNSSESSQDTSGYSSFPTPGEESMSNTRQHNPFYGRFAHQNFNTSNLPVSKGYDSYSQIQMEPENNKFNLMSERQQTKTFAGMLDSNKQLLSASTHKFEHSDHTEVGSMDNHSTMTSDDDMTESITDSQRNDMRPLKNRKNTKTAKSLLSSSEKCMVCRAQAARHVHYGATTCYSCKAFFRRSIQLGAAFKYTCQTRGSCVMLPNTRKACQRCRFDRCLSIGMKSERVLTEKQREKRFRKVRQKKSTSSNCKSDSISGSEATRNVVNGSRSPTNSLEHTESGSEQNMLLENRNSDSFRGPTQSSFLDDWSFEENDHSGVRARNNVRYTGETSFTSTSKGERIDEENLDDSLNEDGESLRHGVQVGTESKKYDHPQIKTEPWFDENDRPSTTEGESTDLSLGSKNIVLHTSNTSKDKISLQEHHNLPLLIKTEQEDFMPPVREGNENEKEDNFRRHSFHKQSKLVGPSSNVVESYAYDKPKFEMTGSFINKSSSLAPQQFNIASMSSSIKSTKFSSIFMETPRTAWKSPYDDIVGPREKKNTEFSRTTLTLATTSSSSVSSTLPIDLSANQQLQNRGDERSENMGVVARLSTLFIQAGSNDISIIEKLVTNHDIQYKSINFGEGVIKEMIMSSVFGIPVSAEAAMTAYRLMIQRVTRVAQNFTDFVDLPSAIQTNLLKNNADTIVSLRGAVFFEMKKQGLDQILSSLGIDDLQAARDMIFATLKSHNTLKRIDYKTFNTIQDKQEGVVEHRYDQLLEGIGATIAFNPNMVILFSYVLLFSVSMNDYENFDDMSRERVLRIQDALIGLLERYVYAIFTNEIARGIFCTIMKCIGDLRELTLIKKKRQLSATLKKQPTEEDEV